MRHEIVAGLGTSLALRVCRSTRREFNLPVIRSNLQRRRRSALPNNPYPKSRMVRTTG